MRSPKRPAAGLGGGTIALPLDVTDRSSFAAFLDAAERELGPVDVVINNAGIMPALMPRRWAEAVGRFMGADKLMVEFDRRARSAYEERAAGSGSGAEGEAGSAEASAAEREAA